MSQDYTIVLMAEAPSGAPQQLILPETLDSVSSIRLDGYQFVGLVTTGNVAAITLNEPSTPGRITDTISPSSLHVPRNCVVVPAATATAGVYPYPSPMLVYSGPLTRLHELEVSVTDEDGTPLPYTKLFLWLRAVQLRPRD